MPTRRYALVAHFESPTMNGETSLAIENLRLLNSKDEEAFHEKFQLDKAKEEDGTVCHCGETDLKTLERQIGPMRLSDQLRKNSPFRRIYDMHRKNPARHSDVASHLALFEEIERKNKPVKIELTALENV